VTFEVVLCFVIEELELGGVKFAAG